MRDFPKELLALILECCSLDQSAAVRQVCSTWRSAYDDTHACDLVEYCLKFQRGGASVTHHPHQLWSFPSLTAATAALGTTVHGACKTLCQRAEAQGIPTSLFITSLAFSPWKSIKLSQPNLQREKWLYLQPRLVCPAQQRSALAKAPPLSLPATEGEAQQQRQRCIQEAQILTQDVLLRKLTSDEKQAVLAMPSCGPESPRIR